MSENAFRIFNQFMSLPSERDPDVKNYFIFNNGDVNRFEFPLPQNLEQAIVSKLKSRKYGYSNPKGNKGVLQKIAQYEKLKGSNKSISKNNICITTGVTNGLHLVFNNIFDKSNPDDELIIPTHSYPTIEQIAYRQGINVRSVSTEREDNFLPNIDNLTESITSNSKALFLISPNNPTGSEYTEDLMKQIYSLCRDEDIYLIVDEIFSGLMLNGTKHPTPDYDCEDSKLIRVNGWSKDRGSAGFRLGYIVAPSEIIDQIGDDISSSYGNAPTLFNNFMSKDMTMRRFMLEPENIPENLETEFINYTRVIEDNIKKYEENNNIIYKILGDVPRVIDLIETEGGFSKYIKFDINTDDVTFANNLYKHSGALLVPGSAFNSQENGWFRLTFSVPKSTLENGLNSIKNYLNNTNYI